MSRFFHVEHNGARLAVESRGEGPPLVFLHAGVGDKRMWQQQTAAFGSRWQSVAFDRRGFGDTTCTNTPFSHVDDLIAVLDHGGFPSAVLVGCSQGGRIAIDCALAHPDRAAALVLIAPAISGAPEPDTFAPEIEAKLNALEDAEEAGDLERVNAIEANLWLDGPAMADGRVAGSVRELFLDMNRIALRHPEIHGEVEPASAYERLSELSIPVLVVWGTLDFAYIKDQCRHLVETVPGAQGAELDGVAHLPSLEQPARLNELLQAFLARVDQG